MSKHTPGPWRAVDNGTYFEIRSLRQQLGDACASKFLDDGDNGQANATLMAAAAPQLLQDLTDAAAQLRNLGGEVNAALAARFEATIAAAVGGAE